MLPDDCFVEVSGVKAYVEGSLGLWEYLGKDSHSNGLVTGVTIWWSTISCRHFSIASLYLMGTFLLAWWTVEIEGSRQIVYATDILFVVSNDFGKAFMREIMSHRSWSVKWSWKGEISGIEQSWKGPRGQLWSWEGVTFCTSWPWKGAILKRSCDGWTGLRSDFRFCFLVVFLVMGVLVCKGVLKMRCLASLVLVMASMTVCELVLLGTLNSTMLRWLMWGRRGGCRVLWSLWKCSR